jgi:hypothetical protein
MNEYPSLLNSYANYAVLTITTPNPAAWCAVKVMQASNYFLTLSEGNIKKQSSPRIIKRQEESPHKRKASREPTFSTNSSLE